MGSTVSEEVASTRVRLLLRPREALAFLLFEGLAATSGSLWVEEALTVVSEVEMSLAEARVVLVERLGDGESVATGLISRSVEIESVTVLGLPRVVRRPRNEGSGGGATSVGAEGVEVEEEMLVRGDMSLYAGEFMWTKEGRLRVL